MTQKWWFPLIFIDFPWFSIENSLQVPPEAPRSTLSGPAKAWGNQNFHQNGVPDLDSISNFKFGVEKKRSFFSLWEEDPGGSLPEVEGGVLLFYFYYLIAKHYFAARAYLCEGLPKAALLEIAPGQRAQSGKFYLKLEIWDGIQARNTILVKILVTSGLGRSAKVAYRDAIGRKT